MPRDIFDRHFTPPNLAKAIVQDLLIRLLIRTSDRVWEPHAGDCAFGDALRRFGWNRACIIESDIAPRRSEVVEHDALTGWNSAWGRNPDWVIGNPPFSRWTGETKMCTKCAGVGRRINQLDPCETCDGTGKVNVMETIWHEHVRVARETAKYGVAFLLRNSFIEPTEDRIEHVKDIASIWPVTPRPSYDGPDGPSKGTDSVGSSVFIWMSRKSYSDGFVPIWPLKWTR